MQYRPRPGRTYGNRLRAIDMVMNATVRVAIDDLETATQREKVVAFG